MVHFNGQPLERDPTTATTILVVEDDAAIGALLTEAIENLTPHHAVLVTNGFQALSTVGGLKPKLFILDYWLPGMNGLDLYDRCHEIEGLENIPAIMISASLPREEIAKRNLVGLSKPFKLHELLKRIEQVLLRD